MTFSFIRSRSPKARNRNHVPRVHVYPDRVFIVVHAPQIGAGGHVNYLELDQIRWKNFLVTYMVR
jgi:magnesium transporter